MGQQDMAQKIPRAEIDQFKEIFREAIDKVDPESKPWTSALRKVFPYHAECRLL